MSKLHFELFRSALGCYLFVHFVTLFGYSAELFSIRGVFSDPHLLPTFGWFPNPLFLPLSDLAIHLFLGLLAGAALLLAVGRYPRSSAVVLWFGSACLLSRAPFIGNPSIPFVGLLLLGVAAVPRGDVPPKFFWHAIWMIMAISYSISGVHKLGAPSWVDGSAIRELVENPLARDNFVSAIVRHLPPSLVAALTYGGLSLEILFFPLALFKRLRFWIWFLMVLMHLGILSMIGFADLTFGMLLLHFFTFDESWIKPRAVATTEPPVVFVDGTCAFCNASARTIVELDANGIFRLAPIQGETAQRCLPSALREHIETVVLYEPDSRQIFVRTDALLRVGQSLGGLVAVLSFLLHGCPRFIRDFGYKVFSRNRHRISRLFRLETCQIPSAEARARYLK